ncbi:hypothetical protein [Dyella amyloliquefaciens]|uniref:hypothetical protein n=1 Tax=Dyella amyloliquefaciens TaxID=1770545 RepID=UPI00102EBAD4|nr:hypothetical protein [Dyella amyloliquefaciens]
MKVSRYAILALATAVALGFAVSPVMAQQSTPTQSAQDASKDAMKSSSDAMKSGSDDMKSANDSMKSDTKSSSHHNKKQHKKGSEPASSSTAGH